MNPFDWLLFATCLILTGLLAWALCLLRQQMDRSRHLAGEVARWKSRAENPAFPEPHRHLVREASQAIQREQLWALALYRDHSAPESVQLSAPVPPGC